MRKVLPVFIVVMLLSGGVSFGQRSRYNGIELQKMFDIYNEAYFNGELPSTPVTWADLPKENGGYVLGNTSEDISGKTFTIQIDVKSNVAAITAALTLFHEMCHVATMQAELDADEDTHGPRFQKCMLRLAQNGAFSNLW